MKKYSACSGKDVIEAIYNDPKAVLACNIRHVSSVEGIMKASQALDAAVMFEIASSELEYTGTTPRAFAEMIRKKAKKLRFRQPYSIHADHVGPRRNSRSSIRKAMDRVRDLKKAGFTSYAIDASAVGGFGRIVDATARLSRLVRKNVGLEVEISSIGGRKTSPDEAVAFIEKLRDNGIYPDALAINNGTRHGRIYGDDGAELPKEADVGLTERIVDDARRLGVVVVQHGAVGLPADTIIDLRRIGVKKFNMAVNWQDIVFECLEKRLRQKMGLGTAPRSKQMAEESDRQKKRAYKRYRRDLKRLNRSTLDRITERTFVEALQMMTRINSQGTGAMVRELLKSKKP